MPCEDSAQADLRLRRTYTQPLRKHAYSTTLNISLPKTENFRIKILIFFIFLLKTDCGYSLEPPHRGSSNEYPQSIARLIWYIRLQAEPMRYGKVVPSTSQSCIICIFAVAILVHVNHTMVNEWFHVKCIETKRINTTYATTDLSRNLRLPALHHHIDYAL